MGNSNIQPSYSSDQQIEIHRHSYLYGRYRLIEEDVPLVVKQYWIKQDEHAEFIRLLEIYKSFNCPFVLKVNSFIPVGQMQNQTIKYQVKYEYCSKTLAEQKNMNVNLFSQIQTIRVIMNVSQALLALLKHKMSLGVLIPEKIGITERGYVIALDILMNGQLYLSKEAFTNQKINPFMPPEEITQLTNYKGYSQSSSAVYSLGRIALYLINQTLPEQQKAAATIYDLRSKCSYQFCQLLMLMLANPEQRYQLQDIPYAAERIKKILQNSQGKDPYRRGYNCVQSLYLMEQTIQTDLAQQKWVQIYDKQSRKQ